MKKLTELERMSPQGRRRFLKMMGVALAAPGIPAALRYGCNDLLGGDAHAQAAEVALPTYFIEINYRDQVDLGEVFVAPGLATYTNLMRGEKGRKAAMFYQQAELIQRPNNVYLTPGSMVLDPHLDNIAMIDTCEMTPGAIHYHQAANRARIPDCGYDQTAGTLPVYSNDPISNFPQGCEKFFGAVPSPASFHNYVQKNFVSEKAPRNGVAIKGISRSIHTVYHFGAGLQGAELDRMQNKDSLFKAFPDSEQVVHTLPTTAEADFFARLLNRVDPRFLERRRFAKAAIHSHTAEVDEARQLLYSDVVRKISLPLTPDEIAYWKTGVPEPQTNKGLVEGQEAFGDVRFQIWEQYAFAYKLVTSGLTRTVAIECEFVDIHDQRMRGQMTIHTQQLALPLARLIESLKKANMFDRTLIAIYTLDGSRAPAAGSAGNEGKNTVMLAGGMIKGGYFGDVVVTGPDGDGHKYGYQSPNLVTGAKGPVMMDNEGRVPGKNLWRTVMKALGVPDSKVAQFGAVSGAAPLPFVLKA